MNQQTPDQESPKENKEEPPPPFWPTNIHEDQARNHSVKTQWPQEIYKIGHGIFTDLYLTRPLNIVNVSEHCRRFRCNIMEESNTT